MTDYTKEEEYTICDKITNSYNCKVIKNNEPPYTLFLSKDIGKILNIKNIRISIVLYPEEMIKTVKYNTKGGEQMCKFLTLYGLIRLITISRKPETINFAKDIGINITKRKFVCIETDCLECIKQSFSGETMIHQYPVNNFRIDLYFPDYNLCIECDEYSHISRKEYDNYRQEFIEETLNNCTFIRFCPDEKNFNIFTVINKIFIHIKNFNKKH